MNDKRRKKQPTVIAQSTTHWSITIFPMLFTAIALYYTFYSTKINPLLIGGILLSWAGIYYFNFYGKKIILTDKKIYVYSKGKKIISWSLAKDFAYINYEQTNFNRFFKCGTLIIVSESKEMYTYFFLEHVEEMHAAIITAFENEMVRLNPQYVRQYVPEHLKKNNLDKIEDN